jgi:hypothetical protein
MRILNISLLACAALMLAQAQKTFDTPQAAADALISAAADNNTAQLDSILGPQGKTLLTSGNPAQDKSERQEFSSIAKNKHELQRDSMNANRMILSVGNEDWPFPVPIVKKNNTWMFDTSMGSLSMRARQIGAGELDAIEICAGYVGAQQAYSQRRDSRDDSVLQYAKRIQSTPGKQDGLYWDGQGALVPHGFAEAATDHPKPYHGYFFRVLTAQGPNAPGGAHNYMAKDLMIGGFALVAWPAQYGVTGIHTFIVNTDGVVYEKDLGAPANALVPPVTRYDPDKTWTPVN